MDRQRLGYEEQAQFTTPSLFVISSAARPLPGPASPPLPYLPAFLVDFSPISSDRVDYDTHTHTITVVYFTPPVLPSSRYSVASCDQEFPFMMLEIT